MQEDRADRYATAFMKARGYNIDAPIQFLCSLPAAQAGDAHSTGTARAKNVANLYWGDQAPDDPCHPTVDSNDFRSTLKKILADAPNGFANLKDDYVDHQTWLANIKFQSAANCKVSNPSHPEIFCLFRDKDPSDIIAQLRDSLDMQSWTFDSDTNSFDSHKYERDDIRIHVFQASNGAIMTVYAPR